MHFRTAAVLGCGSGVRELAEYGCLIVVCLVFDIVSCRCFLLLSCVAIGDAPTPEAPSLVW